MPLTLPSIDDRNFQQLMDEARQRIIQTAPGWNDLSPSDPGIVLLEVFAHLTEIMIYRLNRLPEKSYIAFLRLLGVSLYPPSAASVTLRFSLAQPAASPVEIPRSTRVTLNRSDGSGEPPIFITAKAATIAPGEDHVDVVAYQSDLIEGELVGYGTGLPALSVTVQKPPVIAPTGDELDLVVGVEATGDELKGRAPAISFNNKTFRIWREVDTFTNLGADRFAYVVDRITGTIRFAPSIRSEQADGELTETAQALAEVPAKGREIRVWYRRGGGPAGNVPANSLTTLKDTIAGVQVTNPERATGGRAAETLENALIRGPQEIHSLQRAVIARDFENIAIYSSRTVVRAKAITKAATWAFAAPGTVEVLLVPYVSDDGARVTLDMLREHETAEARARIQETLDERKPLGTKVIVSWANYKPVRVKARIVVGREENQNAVRDRVIKRLQQTITPLPTPISLNGWPFGQTLNASHVYDIALKEPGVRVVDNVRLIVEAVPDKSVTSIATDPFLQNTWYVGSANTAYRSMNNGEGWEPLRSFGDQQIALIRLHPAVAGLLVVATALPDQDTTFLHISQDAGETWQDPPLSINFAVKDVAWTRRDGNPLLLLATDKGFYELATEGSGPVQIAVDTSAPDRGFYAVAVSVDVQGVTNVALAAQDMSGVYLSSSGGASNTFRRIGLQNKDIRVLAVQTLDSRLFLWAGLATQGGSDPGSGAFRWELRGTQDDPDGWRAFSKNWAGGSCRSLAFLGSRVMAATHRSGVMRLNPQGADPAWETPDVRSGLPLRDAGRFNTIATVAVDNETGLVLAGSSEGVFASTDQGMTYRFISNREFADKVTLPQTWLFVSGDHEIDVTSEG